MVTTTNGPVDTSELGITLMHEHIFVNLQREFREDGVLHDPELQLQEIQRFKDAGGGTIVDVTPMNIRCMSPLVIRRLSEESGLHVILGTGLYRDPYNDREWLDRTSTDELADIMVRELEEGIDGTGVRAGIIGEIGCNNDYLSAGEERSFRAAARAHLRTGVTITTHATRWPVGLLQLDVFESEGVDPRRVVIGHCDSVPSTDFHETVARRGAFVEFDLIRGKTEYDTNRVVNYVRELIRKGFLEHILLSQDMGFRSGLHIFGGPGYDFILTTFVHHLREAGVTQDELDVILISNPARALENAAQSTFSSKAPASLATAK